VNISAHQLSKANYVERRQNIYGRTPESQRIFKSFEILEADEFNDIDYIYNDDASLPLNVAVKFCPYGIFGTGYSSLTISSNVYQPA